MSLRKVKDIGKVRKNAKKGGWGYKKVSGSVYEPVRLKKKAPKKTKRKTTAKKKTQTKKKSTRRKTSRK